MTLNLKTSLVVSLCLLSSSVFAQTQAADKYLSQLKVASNSLDRADVLVASSNLLQQLEPQTISTTNGPQEIALLGQTSGRGIQCHIEVAGNQQQATISRETLKASLISVTLNQQFGVYKIRLIGKDDSRSLVVQCSSQTAFTALQLQQTSSLQFIFQDNSQQAAVSIDQNNWQPHPARVQFSAALPMYIMNGADGSQWSQASFVNQISSPFSPLKFEMGPSDSYCKLESSSAAASLPAGLYMIQSASVSYFNHWNQTRTLTYKLTLALPQQNPVSVECYSKDVFLDLFSLIQKNLGAVL
ncbi:MAG: hypothetical protein ACOYOK_01000 [Pseudobdellovibrionaceae bacterium]